MLKRLRDIVSRVLTTRAAWPVLLAVGLLCVASIFALKLSSPERADKQQVHILVGACVLLVVLLPHYQWIGRLAFPFMAGVAVLLVAVLFTEKINGSRRWFNLGSVALQPSELAKLAFVLCTAWYLRYRKDIRTFGGLLFPFAIMLVPFTLILVEPDLGTALLFPLVLFAMLIAAGARFRHLTFIVLVALVAVPTCYPMLKDYQKQRLLSLLPHVQNDPEHLKGPGYQGHQSMVAHGSGGATGEGREGAYLIQHGLLPEAYTDFIFAVIGAQWGFAGCVVIFILYLAFFGAAAEIAGSTKDGFGRLLAVGLASLILFQALINMAMTIGMGPVVGIALPFLSYGGSSLITNMIAAGLLLNVSVRRQSKLGAYYPEYASA